MQQVIIGLDTTEMVSEMELIGQAENDFDMEETEDDDSSTDDDEDDDDEDDDDEDEESGGYENVTTLLLYFVFIFSLTKDVAITFSMVTTCCRNGFHF